MLHVFNNFFILKNIKVLSSISMHLEKTRNLTISSVCAVDID